MSKDSELATGGINGKLCDEGRLLLPKIEKDQLEIYRVKSLKQDLILNTQFKVFEPGEQCVKVDYADVECVIVPALGFDKNNHRIGYGLGFYDKLLSQVDCTSFGVAFLEQELKACLNVDAHDRPVSTVFYF